MDYFISSEDAVKKYPNNDYMSFYNKKVQFGIWKQASGIDSAYAFVTPQKPKACIVLLPGRAEAIVKYAELIYELFRNDYAVFAIDHQGQGKSSRLLANRHIGYVASFEHFAKDLHQLLISVLTPLLTHYQQQNLPKLLLCHSMGGAIASLYVQTYPKTFKKIVLCAPMIGVAAPLPEIVISALVGFAIKCRSLMGMPVGYFFGQGDYQAFPFEKNRLTNSRARYSAFKQVMAEQPENQLGGISFEWLQQAIICMRIIRKQAKLISIPCLILQAEQEQIVDNKKMSTFAKTLPNAQLVKVANAQHEILFEQDTARMFAMNTILDFYVA